MKKLFLLFAVLLSSIVNAQELPKFTDNWQLNVGAGITAQWGDYDLSSRFNPQVNVGMTKFWHPVIGTRLNAEWGRSQIRDNFSVERMGIYADLVFNPINLFNDNYNRPVDLDIFGGVGYIHSFPKDLTKFQYLHAYNHPAGNFIAPRVGLRLIGNISEPIALYAEGSFTAVNDKFDKVIHKAQYDGILNVSFGFIFRFLNHDGTRHFNLSTDKIDDLNAEINTLRAELDKKPKEVINTVVKHDTVQLETIIKFDMPLTVRFNINSSELLNEQKANLENIFVYLKDHEDVEVLITGYADAETGNPDYNMELSCKRAEAVKQYLINKGINSSRLFTGCEGDKVQQYEENDWNRAVIISKK